MHPRDLGIWRDLAVTCISWDLGLGFEGFELGIEGFENLGIGTRDLGFGQGIGDLNKGFGFGDLNKGIRGFEQGI